MHRVCFITAPSGEESLAIARDLVEGKLVACVNIIPGVRSVYTWKGKVEDSAEDLLVAKTRADLVDAVIARVKEIHSYEVPEVIALEIGAGLPEYLAWIGEVTR